MKLNIFNKKLDESYKPDPDPVTVIEDGQIVSDATGHLTHDLAFNIADVNLIVRRVSETLGALPINLINQSTTKIDNQHPVSKLIKKPNSFQTFSQLIETVQAHLELRGKAFLEIGFDNKSYPDAVQPLNPDHIKVYLVDGKQVFYHTPTKQYLPDWKIIYFKGLCLDGINPVSPLQYARHTLGLSLAGARLEKNSLKNGVTAGSVLTLGKELSSDKEKKKELEKQIRDKYQGLKNSGGLMVLGSNSKLEPLKLSFEDIQFLDSKKFRSLEICKFFNVDRSLIGEHSSGYKSLEQDSIQLVRYTYTPRINRIEQTLLNALIQPFERDNYKIKFDIDSLYKAELSTRFTAYKTGVESGVITIDEARSMEDMKPHPDGLGGHVMGSVQYQTMKKMIQPDLKKEVSQEHNRTEFYSEKVSVIDTFKTGFQFVQKEKTELKTFFNTLADSLDSVIKKEVNYYGKIEGGRGFIRDFVNGLVHRNTFTESELNRFINSYSLKVYQKLQLPESMIKYGQISESGELNYLIEDQGNSLICIIKESEK